MIDGLYADLKKSLPFLLTFL